MKQNLHQQRVRDLERRIEAMESSLSWRITAPLRKIGSWLAQRTGMLVAGREVDRTADAVYAEWIREYDTQTEEDRVAIRRQIASLSYTPLISIVMPVYNPPPELLQKAVESVLGQLYPRWELCIADDASTDPRVREVLEIYRAQDERIRVVYREKNGHISASSNSALALATGQFVALLDQDDELAELALYYVGLALAEAPATDLLYSDEDKIDEQGNRFEPAFKPDWSPDLFFCLNYFSHLGVYRTELVRQVGGFRLGYEGSQDYDLCLRCVAATEPSRIRHLPRVLYHWRATGGSTALSTYTKTYAEKAGHRALSDYFARMNPGVTVGKGKSHITYSAAFPLPDPPQSVSIIIPTRDHIKILRNCIDSIRKKTAYENYEIIVVDNQSVEKETHDYFSRLKQLENIRVVNYDAPFNYSAINNFAVAQASGEVLVFVNNDIEVVAGNWLAEMVRHAFRPDVGAVGAKLIYPTGRIQHAGIVLGLGGIAGHVHNGYLSSEPGYCGRLGLTQNVAAVTAACLAVRRELFLQVGGFDEVNLPVAFNDVDFCLRLLAAGYRNVWTPYAELIHHESLSRGADTLGGNAERLSRETEVMEQRWGSLLQDDPYYNPNLTLTNGDCSLAWPPRLDKPWRPKTVASASGDDVV